MIRSGTLASCLRPTLERKKGSSPRSSSAKYQSTRSMSAASGLEIGCTPRTALRPLDISRKTRSALPKYWRTRMRGVGIWKTLDDVARPMNLHVNSLSNEVKSSMEPNLPFIPLLSLVILMMPPSTPPSTTLSSSSTVQQLIPPHPTNTSSGTATSSTQSSFPLVLNRNLLPLPSLEFPKGKFSRYKTFSSV